MVDINVCLKFLGTGFKNYFQARVKIFDSNNCLVYDGFSSDGIIRICLDRGCAYRVYAFLLNYYFVTTIYIVKQDLFTFNLSPLCNRTITFLLTDYNYDNLPIMEGELILGKNN